MIVRFCFCFQHEQSVWLIEKFKISKYEIVSLASETCDMTFLILPRKEASEDFTCMIFFFFLSNSVV